MRDFMFVLILLFLAGLILYGGIEAFVAFNLWLGEMLGMAYK